MDDCIFCKIINGDIKTDYIYEDDDIVVFNDIRPKAKTHVLVVTKQHIESLAHLSSQQQQLMGKVVLALPKIATDLGLNNGFRTIINTGSGGGQEVPHIHFHILGGGGLPGF